MKIGIIGYGVVGKAVDNTLREKYKIIKYDKYQKLDNFESINDCHLVFITVPTPFDCSSNKVDDSAVFESLNKLADLNYNGIVLIKSTLPPGSCENYSKRFNLEIAFNPEFLRESTTPDEDFQNQDTVVIGTHKEEIFIVIKNMYRKVLITKAKYYHTTSKEAEMIKCAQNTMLASRVSIANIIYDACQDHNIDYDKLREIAFDNFEVLGPHMVQVPGPDGKRGFGGKCLPKDILAFSTITESILLMEIIRYNNSLRNDLSNFLKNYNG
tara:strand:+ start:318 stop:1124 length:807 start_codon:yes stop_codon:yes gene_type:complete